MMACAALAADLKIGVIVVGDETEGYTLSHMNGIKEAAANLGIADNQIIWKYKCPEDQTCYDAALDCIGQGCNLIISNSYGHQTYMVLAAEEYPDVTFASMTGDFAALTGLDNFKNAFTKIYDFLKNVQDDEKYHYAMVGYKIKNTVTEQGTVSRGICTPDENGLLSEIVERTKIGIRGDEIYFTEDGVDTVLDPETLVSMNLWGFTPSYIKECNDRFAAFLSANIEKNPEKCEFFIPTVVSNLIGEGKADVKVLDNEDKWYGVTYKEDKIDVVNAFKELKKQGIYPENF
jgi:hypothetical protein